VAPSPAWSLPGWHRNRLADVFRTGLEERILLEPLWNSTRLQRPSKSIQFHLFANLAQLTMNSYRHLGWYEFLLSWSKLVGGPSQSVSPSYSASAACVSRSTFGNHFPAKKQRAGHEDSNQADPAMSKRARRRFREPATASVPGGFRRGIGGCTFSFAGFRTGGGSHAGHVLVARPDWAAACCVAVVRQSGVSFAAASVGGGTDAIGRLRWFWKWRKKG